MTELHVVPDERTPVERHRDVEKTFERYAREAQDGFAASSFLTLAACARMLADALERQEA